MDRTTLLLTRLDDIAKQVEKHPQGLALMGLGSVGVERSRLDQYSDLDFYVISKDDQQPTFVDDLDWLSAVCPISYAFKNTDDGYKLMFEDGIFCEFGVYDRAQLANTEHAEGHIIWASPEVSGEIVKPNVWSVGHHTQDFLVGELLTNLYVGLCRYQRGEHVSALAFIQVYAFDRLTNLLSYWYEPCPSLIDPFSPDRRVEQRYPMMIPVFTKILSGYQNIPDSAKVMLDFVKSHIEISQPFELAIRKLIDEK